jgi:transposase
MNYLKSIERYVENKVVFCGIDVHTNYWDLCFLSEGEVLERIRLESEITRLYRHVRKHYGTARSVRFVYEAGFSGFYLYRKLTSAGYDCMITPPNRIPRMGDKVKTDKRDALKLAQFHAGGLLRKVYVPPVSVESDRHIVRQRDRTMRKLSRVKTQIKSYLKLYEIKWPRENGRSWTKCYVEWLESLEIADENIRYILDDYLSEYRHLRERVSGMTTRMRRLSRSEAYYSNYKILTSLKGVGLITAMTYLLELYDMSRFSSGQKLGSYLGLTPSQFSSGDRKRFGHITREGNARVRKALVESAWTVIRHDPVLREKYNRIRARGTNGKKAIVAVARTLAIRMRYCLLNEEPYVIGVC